MAVRDSFEYLSYALLLAGALIAIGGDRLDMHTVREAGVAVAFLGAIAFGLDMIVKRRADIATRYSSTTSPRFHVFRGPAAIAWGIAFALFAGTLVGFGIIELTGWTAAKDFFRERPGIVIVLAGTIVAAWGLGSASKATYLSDKQETPASRLGDRLFGMFGFLVGLILIGLGLLRTFAPSVVDGLKARALELLIDLVPR